MQATHKVLMAKSNHIFAWPFEFKAGDQTVEQFAAPFEKKGWIRKEMDVAKPAQEGRLNTDIFMLNQYLSISAKNIFMHEDEHICTVFEYPFQEGETWQYLIQAHDSADFEYRLAVASVELHVYRHGVGILFLHTVNYDYPGIEDIKKINDYGRRIAIPFLPDGPGGFMLCADRLGIEGKGWQCVTDFRRIACDCLSGQAVSGEGLWEPAGFLHVILNCRAGKNLAADGQVLMKPKRELSGRGMRMAEDIPDIQSTSDDRMELLCLIRDDTLSDRAAQTDWKQPANDKDEAFQKLLYSIVYADPADVTCQNAEMRSELLEKAVYARWSDYGTLYGITNFSMICLTGETPDIEAGVLRPFIVEYVYLLSLVLAQRIGITAYSEQAGKIVKGVDKKGTIKTRQAKTLINLQEKYITFKNQILILEASCQEQGIDIYHLLQRQMMVQEEQEVLDEQLESLYEATNVSVGNFFASKGIWWAIIAIGVDVAINISTFWLEHGGYEWLRQLF